ncbi:TetR/AcrR family transcriptional regulator [Pararobbsia alpina]|uniref:HTH-type transcriptional regulator BetI n=1 Tax=Pararobbsia alpina TaxID=621374 RepID=A0A6S7BB12_9BURK|nr:TetR/AcrR family transcriptional regulator [Pararobbsia alpina]CAB3792118.1 HTH-type transcriptional regulator BetI [Pararobbsia alpina]
MSVAERTQDALLRPALLRAAVSLIEESGIGAVSVREAAKRAGVSPCEPFNFFASKGELLTAIAEEAMESLVTALQAAILDASHSSAMNQCRATGHAFLRWAFDNPVHFQVMSTPALLDFESSGLAASQQHIRAGLKRLIAAAAAEGDLYCVSVEDTLLAARAFVYGLARMQIDGQMPGWGVPRETSLETMQRLFDAYLFRLRRG